MICFCFTILPVKAGMFHLCSISQTFGQMNNRLLVFSSHLYFAQTLVNPLSNFLNTEVFFKKPA